MTALIFLLNVLVGGTGSPLIKLGVTLFAPVSFVVLRSLILTLALLPFVYKEAVFARPFNKYMLIANLLFALNWIFFAFGIQRTSVIMAQFIYVPTSLVVGIIGYLFLKEKLTKEQIIGLAVTIIGMGFLAFKSIQSNSTLSFGTPTGNILVTLGLFTWAAYIVITRKISKSFSPKHILFNDFLLTFLISLIILPITAERLGFHLFTQKSTLALLSACFASLGFFMFNQWLIKHTTAFISSLAIYPITIFAAVFSVIFYNEVITPAFLIGSALIAFGVFLSTSYKYVRKYVKII